VHRRGRRVLLALIFAGAILAFSQQDPTLCPWQIPDCNASVIQDPDLIMAMESLINSSMSGCGGVWDEVAIRMTSLLYQQRVVRFDPGGSGINGYWIGYQDGSVTVGVRDGVFDGSSIANPSELADVLKHEGLHDHLSGDQYHTNSLWNDMCLGN
jgi:hypothetical protein